ncbi:hypothetical protein BJ170DRAFT_714478, partial [Xylariales sp. AK1849]
ARIWPSPVPQRQSLIPHQRRVLDPFFPALHQPSYAAFKIRLEASPVNQITMSSICDHLLPSLCDFLGVIAQNGITAACIEAPPTSGKSTQLVPALWDHINATYPGTLGFYIVQQPSESRLLHEFFEQSGSLETAIEEIDRGRKLNLGSYAYFSTRLNEHSVVDPTRTRCVMLFLDIELVPTAAGEALLAKVVNWMRDTVAANVVGANVAIKLMLLGSHIRPMICQVIEESLSLKIKQFSHTTFGTERSVAFRRVKTTGSDEVCRLIKEFVSEVLLDEQVEAEETEGPPGPCVVLFMDHDEARHDIVEAMQTEHMSRLPVHWLSLSTASRAIRRAMSDPRRKLICIDPSMTFAMPIQNVRRVMSTCFKVTRVFDPDTAQYPLARRGLSKIEITKQAGWLAAEGTLEFTILVTDGWLSLQPTAPRDPPHADLARMILEQCGAYEDGLPNFDVPVPAFHEVDLARLRDARRRLLCAQSIEGPVNPNPTPLGEEMIRFLQRHWRDPRSDLDLAHLVARTKLSSGVTESAKRILIRLAAITRCRARRLFFLTERATQFLKDGQVGHVLDAIKKEVSGVTSHQYTNGTLWIALGLWQQRKLRGKLPDDTQPDVVYVADNLVGFDCRAARYISAFVRMLERDLGLQPLDDDQELLGTLLSETELLGVNEILAWSYMNQMVLFPLHPSQDAPVDIASMRKVDVNNTLRLPIDLDARYTGLSVGRERDGYVGIYQEAMLAGGDQGSGGLLIMDLTLVPNLVFAKLESDTGLNLLQLVRTTYPVPTNAGRNTR